MLSFHLADTTTTFSWGAYLKSTDSHAAPVNYFRHVKIAIYFIELEGFFSRFLGAST